MKIIFYLSLFSLIFYFLYTILNFKLGLILDDRSTHNLIYHYKTEGLGYHRNSGPFWEPAAFGGYIILGLFFILRDSLKIEKKIIITLIITLITTLSTTSYICLSFVFCIYLLKNNFFNSQNKYFILRILLILIIFIFLFKVFNEVDFLKDKIYYQTDMVRMQMSLFELTRFGNFIYDIEIIKKYPFFGLSANVDMRSIFDPNYKILVSGQGNALSGFATRFGLIGLFTALLIFIKLNLNITKSFLETFMYLLLICMLLFTEKYFNYPLFFTLIFIYEYNFNHRETQNNKN